MKKPSHFNLHKEKFSATVFQEQEGYATTCTSTKTCFHLTLGECSCTTTEIHVSGSFIKSCTHLSLGACPCTTHETHEAFGSYTKKRKLCNKAPTAARKRACNQEERKKRWGYSTTLMLYDDPWRIKKVLQESDLGNMSRLLLPKDLAENLVVPVLGDDAQRNVESEEGIEVSIWDIDTNSMHSLVFKRWGSSRSYVLIGNWVKDFVNRRSLKKEDEIGFHWDPYKNHFNFTILKAV